MKTCRTHTVASWMLQLVAAGILAQTLFFKFSGAAESKYIFSTLGAEPWGRVATGCAELVVVLLLLVRRTAALGALLSIALMTGAIGAHLSKLGIVVMNDGGLLFALAMVVLLSGISLLVLRRHQIPLLGCCFASEHPGPCSAKGCHH
jgi:hypothetical protein